MTLQEAAEAAAAESRRTAIVEYAVAAVDLVIGSASPPYSSVGRRGSALCTTIGTDPAVNRRDLVAIPNLSRSDRERALHAHRGNVPPPRAEHEDLFAGQDMSTSARANHDHFDVNQTVDTSCMRDGCPGQGACTTMTW